MTKMKRTVKQIMFICVLVLPIGCTTSRGYDTIEELYQASFMAIKSKDKKLIADFVSAMLPDKNTARYMEKNNCVYRGFPKGLKEFPTAIDSSIVLTTQYYFNLALSLEDRYGSLDNLQFIGFEEELLPEPLNESQCKCQDVLFEEPWGLFVFQHNNDTIRFKIGEVLKVNGKWKVFTTPKIFY
jgi:hypothetical protein